MPKEVDDITAFVGISNMLTSHASMADFPKIMQLMAAAMVEMNQRLVKLEGAQCRLK